MKFGAVFPQTEIGDDPAAVRDFATAAEELGYDYLVAYDHVIGADPAAHTLVGPYTHESMFHEPLVLFGYLAGVTTRIQLMTSILILPQRQTALVAKQAAEVDLLSGGRLILGVGVGWNQVEYEVLGQEFGRRGRRMEEQLTLLRQLWEQPLVNFEGRFERVRDAGINPLPGRRIPIWMGGMASAVLQRIARHADGWVPRGRFPDFQQSVDDVAFRLGRIRDMTREAGRDPNAIDLGVSVSLTDGDTPLRVERIEAWRAIGATHAAFNTMDAGLASPQQHIDEITAFAEALRSAGLRD